jgi:hypothetical protein
MNRVLEFKLQGNCFGGEDRGETNVRIELMAEVVSRGKVDFGKAKTLKTET